MRKWREDITLIARSLRLIHKISAGILGMMLLQSALVSLSPFITMYMSSVMINGIQDRMELGQLLVLAAVVLTERVCALWC